MKINDMRNLKKLLWAALAAAVSILFSVDARADVRPAWVGQSEKALNAKRTNGSYEFKVLRTEDADLTRLHAGRFFPLFEYLAGQYGSKAEAMSLDSLSTATYRISFETPEGPSSVIARLVDVYESLDYNAVRDPVFEFYQLYAIGRKDTDVEFDEISYSEISRPLAAALSVIPGAGQLYKGNKAKGYALLGTSLVCAGAAVASQFKATEWARMMDQEPGARDSWESKSIAMKRQRNILIGAIGCLSAFSIFDALVGDEVPRLVVNKSDGGVIAVAPSGQSAGIALVIKF